MYVRCQSSDSTSSWSLDSDISSIECNEIGVTQKREQPCRQHVLLTFTVISDSLPDLCEPHCNTILHHFDIIKEEFLKCV